MALYRGLGFPFKKGATEFPEALEDGALIRASIEQIVLTAKNERFMRPDFGSRIPKVVFENNNPALQEAIRAEIVNALSKYEPRITVRQVVVEQQGVELTITIEYTIIATRQVQVSQFNFETSAG